MRNLLIWGGERQKINPAVYPGPSGELMPPSACAGPASPSFLPWAAPRSAAGCGRGAAAVGLAGHPGDPPAVAGDARRTRECCPAAPRQQVAPAGRARPGSCAPPERSGCCRPSPSSAGGGLRSSRGFTRGGGESCGGLLLQGSQPVARQPFTTARSCPRSRCQALAYLALTSTCMLRLESSMGVLTGSGRLGGEILGEGVALVGPHFVARESSKRCISHFFLD